MKEAQSSDFRPRRPRNTLRPPASRVNPASAEAGSISGARTRRGGVGAGGPQNGGFNIGGPTPGPRITTAPAVPAAALSATATIARLRNLFILRLLGPRTASQWLPLYGGCRHPHTAFYPCDALSYICRRDRK